MNIVVLGLGYGDEGKGAVVDKIARTSFLYSGSGGVTEFTHKTVVRYSGGHQAAHNVVTDDGRHHTFSQFGAGTFAGLATKLSHDFIMEPFAAMVEKRLLGSHVTPLHISPFCPVTTAYERAANRFDQRLWGHHASCGVGIGCTRFNFISGIGLQWRDLSLSQEEVAAKLIRIREACESRVRGSTSRLIHPSDMTEFDEVNPFVEAARLRAAALELGASAAVPVGPYIYEGSQGYLLDSVYGDEQATWSRTTARNAIEHLEANSDDYTVLGVLRHYLTRHGDGIMQYSRMTAHDKAFENTKELHNRDDGPQGEFRKASWDMQKLKLLIQASGVHAVAVNHCDLVPDRAEAFVSELEKYIPVVMVGYGPKAADKKWLQPMPTANGGTIRIK